MGLTPGQSTRGDPRGVWGHAPSHNLEILKLQRCIFLHSEAQSNVL